MLTDENKCDYIFLQMLHSGRKKIIGLKIFSFNTKSNRLVLQTHNVGVEILDFTGT